VKIKLTKEELKGQRDALAQYERFLPTLQLKKQQLQLEILRQSAILEEKNKAVFGRISAATAWAGLLSEEVVKKEWLRPKSVTTGSKNIAGVDIPLYECIDFPAAEYDLFLTPLWLDAALEALRGIVTLRQELAVLEKGIAVLRQELRITTQRVNLFEKIKIPEAREAIRVIKIYIGDQMANAVGRSKIAKAKIEEALHPELAVV
jgi:V/A-type H+-transporting ATPase subunit D